MYNLSKFCGIPTTKEMAESDLADQLKLCRKVGEKGFLVIKREGNRIFPLRQFIYPIYRYATRPKQSPKIVKVVKI